MHNDDSSETPVIVSVTVHPNDLGKCKTFDMKQVRDSDYLYVLWHRKLPDQVWNAVTKGLRSASLCATSDYGGKHRNPRYSLYESPVYDGLGRLPYYNSIDEVRSPRLYTLDHPI